MKQAPADTENDDFKATDAVLSVDAFKIKDGVVLVICPHCKLPVGIDAAANDVRGRQFTHETLTGYCGGVFDVLPTAQKVRKLPAL